VLVTLPKTAAFFFGAHRDGTTRRTAHRRSPRQSVARLAFANTEREVSSRQFAALSLFPVRYDRRFPG
jgi:hypothetical protein